MALASNRSIALIVQLSRKKQLFYLRESPPHLRVGLPLSGYYSAPYTFPAAVQDDITAVLSKHGDVTLTQEWFNLIRRKSVLNVRIFGHLQITIRYNLETYDISDELKVIIVNDGYDIVLALLLEGAK
jgi:hypothetical protein